MEDSRRMFVQVFLHLRHVVDAVEPDLHTRSHQIDTFQFFERTFHQNVHQNAVLSLWGESSRSGHSPCGVYKDNPAIFELGPSPVMEWATLVAPQLADGSYLGMTYE